MTMPATTSPKTEGMLILLNTSAKSLAERRITSSLRKNSETSNERPPGGQNKKG
jgi:hypothetical protein